MQHLADGGVVDWLKAKVGIKPDSPELAAYKAEAERERQAQKAAKSIEAAPPAAGRANALSDYAGMGAMQRREKAAGFAHGGLIRGPGTGTSDSIPDEMQPGTFIMPADSTQALGLDQPEGEGAVPVKVSNGEYELPPEQVQAIGQAVLNAVKDVTHESAEGQSVEAQESATGVQDEGGMEAAGAPMQARGFAPQDEQFFSSGGTVRALPMRGQRAAPHMMRKPMAYANGGVVTDDEEKRRALGSNAVGTTGKSGVDAIPTGGVAAPAYDGSTSGTELGRNVNNGLNALGGMGVVATVPLRTAQGFTAAAPEGAALTNAASKLLAGPAQPARAATDFIAGNGPAAVVQGVQRLGYEALPAVQSLPGTNAALQAGGKANLLASQTRATAGAAAGLGALDQQNNAAPEQPAQAATAPESDYARQMRLLGTNLADGAAWLGKTIVSAPGYGFNADRGAPADSGQAAAATSPAASKPTQAPTPTTPPAPVADPNAISATPGKVQRIDRPGQSPLYTDGTDQQMAGFLARGNAPSQQNIAAADALAARSGAEITGRAQAMIAAEQAAKANSPEALRQRAIEYSQNPRGFSRTVFRSLIEAANNAEQQQTQRQSNDTTNRRLDAQDKLARDEFGLKKEAAGFTTRSAARLEQLQTQYSSETDNKKRTELARQIRELQGKSTEAKDRFINLRGEEGIVDGNKVRTGDQLFDAETQQFIQQPASPGRQPPKNDKGVYTPSTAAEYAALPAGARYMKNGVEMVKSN